MAAERRPGSDLSVLFELFVVSQRAGSLLREVMENSPLTPLEYAMYSVVHDSAITPTDMADRLGMAVTTVLDHLRAMEERGHVERMPNPSDGRSYLVSLTPAGRVIHRRAGAEFDRAMTRILAHLDRDESEVIDVLLSLGSATDAAIEELRQALIGSSN
jgi:DNA-binding MarR family transcriptional regulator